MLITRFSHLIQAYHRLGPGDVFIGQVPASQLKAAQLLDLTARGVCLLPSAMAQIVHASKAAQAFLLQPWMLPHTTVIQRRKDLLDALRRYGREGIDCVVTKADRLHCGQGVCKWSDPETLYSCVSMREDIYPFVLQPFVDSFTDVRVVKVGDFCEAYSRWNPHGFRTNLSAGGDSRPYRLNVAQETVCREVMHRSQMPYAHIDLMILPDERVFLSEIRLNGGVHGARVPRGDLDAMKHEHLMALAGKVPGSFQTAEE